MVRILSSGEIVKDDDPRSGNSRRSQPRQQGQQMGGIQHNEQQPQYAQGTVSIFEVFNQRLLGFGIPRWNIGQHTVEPIVSVAALLALLLIGPLGLVLVAILFFVSKWSQSSAGPSQGQGRPSGGGYGGGGQRLGRP